LDDINIYVDGEPTENSVADLTARRLNGGDSARLIRMCR
jgi:hypothetical protein